MSSDTTPTTPVPRQRRSKNPAASAKILATGLSATAMLGMSAGYALAARTDAPAPATTPAQPELGTPVESTLAQATGPQAAVSPLSPLIPATVPPGAVSSPQATPSQPAHSTAAPVVTAAPQPQVIDIPVDTIAPATPGNGGGDWNNQPSSGSN